jgi:hypothetical protein
VASADIGVLAATGGKGSVAGCKSTHLAGKITEVDKIGRRGESEAGGRGREKEVDPAVFPCNPISGKACPMSEMASLQ